MVTIADEICGVKEGQRYGNRIVAGKPFSIGVIRGKKRYAIVAECSCGHVDVLHDLANFKLTNGCVFCFKSLKKHGESGNSRRQSGRTRLYRIWAAMRSRCNNPNTIGWKLYGSRGVKVCDQWNDFGTFRDWAITNGYSDKLTIDRIDSDGNYEPSNCRWITLGENSREANIRRWNRGHLHR